MGRKQKLRQERRNRAAAAAAAEKENPPSISTTTTTTTTTTSESAFVSARLNETSHEQEILKYHLEARFPQSDLLDQAFNTTITDPKELPDLLRRGAAEHGCVTSMTKYAIYLNETNIRASYPWFLEGAIRGSTICAAYLLSPPKESMAMTFYWTKMMAKYVVWTKKLNFEGDEDIDSDKKMHDTLERRCADTLERRCAICSEEDTETLTLQQCIGCCMYYYCSEECQTAHWEEHCHRNECKHLNILNKYHRPYAREIRDAIIRGETDIHTLEKLRYKLGLTRPNEEVYPYSSKHTIARDDGTVWFGSTPNSPIGSSLSDTATATATAFEMTNTDNTTSE
jgi:hypothetical protein